MPTTRRMAYAAGPSRKVPEPPKEDDVSSSSGTDDDEEIPAISPNKHPSPAQPTLSVRRPSTGKRYRKIAVTLPERPQRSSKRRKVAQLSEQDNKRAPEATLHQQSNGYLTPESSRTATAQDVIGSIMTNVSSAEHKETEDNGHGEIDPAVLAVVNRLCGNHKSDKVPVHQRQETGKDAEDGDGEVAEMQLKGHETPDNASDIMEAELDDKDLSVDPSNLNLSTLEKAAPATQIESVNEALEENQNGVTESRHLPPSSPHKSCFSEDLEVEEDDDDAVARPKSSDRTNVAEGMEAPSRNRTVQNADSRTGALPNAVGEPVAATGVDANGETDEDKDSSFADDDDDDESFDAADDIAAQLQQDIRQFGDADPEDNGESSFVELSTQSPEVTIALPSTYLMKAAYLMRRLGWTGVKDNWQKHLTDKHPARTSLCKRLKRHLLDLEVLLQEANCTSDFRHKNQFLRVKNQTLEDVFRKMEGQIQNVRANGLPFPEVTTKVTKAQRKARRRMATDLVRLVIPLVVRVLEEAWLLGGEDESSFTSSSVFILAKISGWLRNLYSILMRELSLRPLTRRPHETDTDMRQKLQPLIERIHNLVKRAPARLEEKEEDMARAEITRQRILRKQEEQKARQIEELESRRQAQEEQSRRLALALRRGQTSDQSSAPVAHWSREKEVALCNYLKNAYGYDPPRLPKLRELGMRLGHNEVEIKQKSRDLLVLMLGMVYNTKSRQAIQATVDDLMQQWK